MSTFEQIESGSVWKQVYQDLGIPVLNSAAGYNVKCAYRKYVQMLPPQLLQAFVFAVLCPSRCLSYIRYPHIVLLSLQRPISIARCNGTCISLTKTVLAFFSRYLYGFEEYCTSTAITFRMDLPLKQGPKGEVKPEVEAGGTAASSAEQSGSLDGEPCGAQSAVCKVHFPKYDLIQFIIFFCNTPYLSFNP